ncbi:MAG TPA: type I 3-dehydroquinate dehydratase [Vicinamibacterales bacterium]|nr:type I 3-dehydroquinate dehydratase [Vicinamibacterales bacterium]
MARVCETVLVDDMRELRRLRDASTADLVELRLDSLAEVDVRAAVEGRKKPVILTCRAKWEGGRFEGSEEERMRILGAAITSDAEFVDVEWRANRATLPPIARERLVLSHHDFTGVPEDLRARAAAMREESGTGIVKVSVSTGPLTDLLTLRDIAAADSGRHVVIGMGTTGILSRVFPASFGSEWTYGGNAAPGQVSIVELQTRYRITGRSASTRVFALTGRPLGHSASPAMHNAAFAALGIDAVYVPLETDDAHALIEVAEAFGVEGVSVTAPLKRDWQGAGVDLDARASVIGAANTLSRRAGARWTATNFDVEGFLAPLKTRRNALPLRGSRCVILGAGGAARAAAWALHQEGARVQISGRRASAAAALAAELGVTSTSWPPAPGWDLLVNATPVGTAPDRDASPLPQSAVKGRAVYDLVYHPRRTQLLRWAQAAGALRIEGLDMLVEQAALQFEHWLGREAPRDVMREAAEQFLAGPKGPAYV